MTKLRIALQLARLKVLVWRLLAERALTRLVRRAIQWMAPAA